MIPGVIEAAAQSSASLLISTGIAALSLCCSYRDLRSKAVPIVSGRLGVHRRIRTRGNLLLVAPSKFVHV